MSKGKRKSKISAMRATLPAGFGIESEVMITTRTIEELKADGGTVKLAMLKSEDGELKIEGMLASPSSLENLKGFAVAKFGTESVDIDAEIVDGLPTVWEKNVFAALQVIAVMQSGQAVLTADRLMFEGVADSAAIRTGLEKILKEETEDVQVAQSITVDARIAARDPGASPASCVERLNNILLENPIQFEKSSTRILDSSQANIARVAQALLGCNAFAFEIGGHTDSQGGDKLNQSISERRAKSVLDAILNHGLEYGELTSRGYGEAEPIASNDTAEGRAQNRRIEIRINANTGGQ